MEKNKKTAGFSIARYWTIRGFTAALLVFAALLPVVTALSINYWLEGQFHWREAALEIGVALLTLSLIAYPAWFLLRWESDQAQRLDNSRQDFRALIDEAADMVLLVDERGLVREANQRAVEILGYTHEEIRHLAQVDIDVDCFLQRHPELEARLYAGESVAFETSFRTRDGRKIPVECRARIANWMERPHIILFVSDISRRREEEKKIRASQEALEKTRNLLELRIAKHSTELEQQKHSRELAERQATVMQRYLEKIIDSMPSALITVDESNCVMQWNYQTESITRIPATRAIGQPLAQVYPQLYQHIQSLTVNQDLLQQNITFHFSDIRMGEERTYEVMIYPILSLHAEEQGEVIRIDDITEKRKISETLVQTEKMLSLGGLAAGMAHEINNPLGAIIQSTQNIKRRLSGELPRNHLVAEDFNVSIAQIEAYIKAQRIDDFLNGILESGERAARIVGDMLSFARPSSQEKGGTVSLIEALDAAVRLAAKDYNQKKKFDFRKIEIRKNYSPKIGPVMAQKNQLEQVFLNLLINAAQAISAVKNLPHPLIELLVRRDGDMACVEIIDNGIGMDEATRRRVFEPFFTTKDEQSGTGLGLSVSYFIVVEQLGGQIRVESQPGQGSRFIISLPLIGPGEMPADGHDEQIELPL